MNFCLSHSIEKIFLSSHIQGESVISQSQKVIEVEMFFWSSQTMSPISNLMVSFLFNMALILLNMKSD